jgi:hypothetical protein
MIDYKMLEATYSGFREHFVTAEPFPYFIWNNLFQADQLLAVAANFPNLAQMGAVSAEPKGQLHDRSILHPDLNIVCDALLAPRFVTWLRDATNTLNLLVDPDEDWGVVRLAGNGVQLPVHVGSNRHSSKNWVRRYSMLVYFNENWTSSDGGEFQLWDSDMLVLQVSILPSFNRAVLIATNVKSFHGHRTIHLPSSEFRKSMTIYYYTESLEPSVL